MAMRDARCAYGASATPKPECALAFFGIIMR
jgi:hypothetical protein